MCKNKYIELKDELEEIKKEEKVRRKQSFRKNSSKLDKYRGEIMISYQVEEVSLGVIQRWLRTKKRMKVARSTILRRINQWVNGER